MARAASTASFAWWETSAERKLRSISFPEGVTCVLSSSGRSGMHCYYYCIANASPRGTLPRDWLQQVVCLEYKCVCFSPHTPRICTFSTSVVKRARKALRGRHGIEIIQPCKESHSFCTSNSPVVPPCTGGPGNGRKCPYDDLGPPFRIFETDEAS